MGEPFIGEIRILGFNWPPVNWALCNGQIMPINQNQSLYSLMGTAYGGNGTVDFGLPDIRGRTPIGNGHDGIACNYERGDSGGLETVTLTVNQMPAHSHTVNATNDEGDQTRVGTDKRQMYAAESSAPNYSQTMTNLTQLNDASCGTAGGNQAHINVQPSQVVSYVIALAGLYPSRN